LSWLILPLEFQAGLELGMALEIWLFRVNQGWNEIKMALLFQKITGLYVAPAMACSPPLLVPYPMAILMGYLRKRVFVLAPYHYPRISF
jgi:hypothetical protein